MYFIRYSIDINAKKISKNIISLQDTGQIFFLWVYNHFLFLLTHGFIKICGNLKQYLKIKLYLTDLERIYRKKDNVVRILSLL